MVVKRKCFRKGLRGFILTILPNPTSAELDGKHRITIGQPYERVTSYKVFYAKGLIAQRSNEHHVRLLLK